MLVLSRFEGERIVIVHPDGTRVFVDIIEVKGDKVRLGVTAPREVAIHRQEVMEKIDAA